MHLFAIALSDDNVSFIDEQVAAKLFRSYGVEFFQLAEKLLLVRSDGITETVAEKAGIYEPDGATGDTLGVVFKLDDSYAGVASPSLWEWLQKE